MKYIIKNCPAYIEYRNAKNELVRLCHSSRNTASIVHFCKDTNCLLKQIVEKCKKKAEMLDYTAIDILSMLEIEELQDET